MLSWIDTKGIQMRISPNVIEQDKTINYILNLKDTTNIQSIELLGNTDAHDIDDDALERFTIVFAKEKTNNSIVDAIRNGLTCAVVKRGENNHQFMGNSDLAHYAYFLI